jgi:hypothetical protein
LIGGQQHLLFVRQNSSKSNCFEEKNNRNGEEGAEGRNDKK